MDQIDFAAIRYAGYALIGAAVVVALLLRRRKNRVKQIIKPLDHHYRCLTVTLPLGGHTVDDAVEHSSVDGANVRTKDR